MPSGPTPACSTPIKPQEDCQHLGGLLGDYPGVEVYGLKAEDVGALGGQTGKHGAEATLRCENGWNALKDESGHRTNQVTVTCRHGHWADEADWNLTCKKDCTEYTIDGSGDVATAGIWHGHNNFGETNWVTTSAEEREMFIKDDRATFDGGDANGDGTLDIDEFRNMKGFDAASEKDNSPEAVFSSLDTVDAVTGEKDQKLDFEEFDAEYFTYGDRPHRGGAFHSDHEALGVVGRVPGAAGAGGQSRLAKGYNLANRSRDYVIRGNGLEHGAKRKISCAKGYGAVAGTPDALARNMEKVRCVNGEWEPQQTLECSTCFDARSADWRDEAGNDCVFYASRPMECTKSEGARANCRIACRSCDEAADKYKIKAVQNNVQHVKHRSSWHYQRMKVKVGHQVEKNDARQVKVAKYIAK